MSHRIPYGAPAAPAPRRRSLERPALERPALERPALDRPTTDRPSLPRVVPIEVLPGVARPGASLSDLWSLVLAFEDGRLGAADWTPDAQLAVAAWHLALHGPELAADRIALGLRQMRRALVSRGEPVPPDIDAPDAFWAAQVARLLGGRVSLPSGDPLEAARAALHLARGARRAAPGGAPARPRPMR